MECYRMSSELVYIVGFALVEMAISTNPKPTMYRNLYENTVPGLVSFWQKVDHTGIIWGTQERFSQCVLFANIAVTSLKSYSISMDHLRPIYEFSYFYFYF